MNIYVTFGQIHVHSVNGKTFDKDCVAMFEAKDYEEGRKKAFKYFGDKFHNTYDEEDITPELMSYFPCGIIKV